MGVNLKQHKDGKKMKGEGSGVNDGKDVTNVK